MAGIAPSIAQTTAAYLKILRWALFPGLLFAACRQYLQTMNITRPQLAAVAAALSEVRLSRYRFRGFRASTFRGLLRIGAPAGLQMLADVGAFSFVTMLSGRLGAAAAAAHQIALNLASMSFMAPLGISYAAAVRVGQGIGREQPKSAARSGYAALGLGVAFMSLASMAYLFLPGPILRLYTTDPAVTALGVSMLGVAAFFQVFDGAQVVLTGSLRGLRETRIPMAANAIGYWLIGLPAGIYLAFWAGWGVLGLWLGLCLGLCLVAAALLWVWARRARTLRQADGSMRTRPADSGSP
ncbi:MAG: hypothetical protein HY922_06570 [Elusimicrobia bacterium]|nr:hypothetical protein [Elusimicrobiota bacterium]